MREHNTVSFEVGEVIAETSKAILVIIEDEEIWVPQSQISENSEVWSVKNGTGQLVVSEWWARQRGLI